MHHPRHPLTRLIALVCLLGSVAASHAQSSAAPVDQGPQPSDPARWYVEDSSSAAQLRTLRKEIGAALQEALTECKRSPATERAACVSAARNTYQQDMARATQQHPAGSGKP